MNWKKIEISRLVWRAKRNFSGIWNVYKPRRKQRSELSICRSLKDIREKERSKGRFSDWSGIVRLCRSVTTTCCCSIASPSPRKAIASVCSCSIGQISSNFLDERARTNCCAFTYTTLSVYIFVARARFIRALPVVPFDECPGKILGRLSLLFVDNNGSLPGPAEYRPENDEKLTDEHEKLLPANKCKFR